jgi:hypothetical protein
MHQNADERRHRRVVAAIQRQTTGVIQMLVAVGQKE